MKIIFYFFLFTILHNCSENKNLYFSEYIGYLKANDSIQIPFNFQIKNNLMIISNAEELVELKISVEKSDSLKVESPYFEDIIMYFDHKDSLSGFYYNNSLDRKIPFNAKHGNKRFDIKNEFKNFSGSWRVIFNYNDDDAFDAEMMVDQNNHLLEGTIRTETGDYGFMQGVSNQNRISMSNFNGYRAYMLDGYLKSDTVKGFLYMGNYNSRKFIAFKQEGFNLSDPYGLTKMKDGYENFIFSFKNTEGKLISDQDKKFDGKVNIIQIMGSWCPNCLDESIYLSKVAEDFENVMITSIAFEFAKSEEKALKNLKKLKNKLRIDYDILLAQFGSSNKEDALKKLPSLESLISYPTLIVVDKNKKVRRIHTGFNGPATGEKYQNFIIEFEHFIETLINED